MILRIPAYDGRRSSIVGPLGRDGFPIMCTLEELHAPLALGEQRYLPPAPPVKRLPGSTFRQLLRFGVVGCLNTLIDLLALNGLFWLWPTQNVGLLLIENSTAYGFGA